MLLATSLASAQPAADDKRVDALYSVAKKAFDSGRYGEAMRALEECHRLTGDPTYLWRIGYAAEKSYWASQKDEDLRKAVESYRAYLAAAPQGPKRAVATQALQKLGPLVPKADPVDPQNPATPTPPPVAPKQRTGVMISSSTPGATIELDGKLRANGFLEADVESGPHKIRVRADGYEPVDRDVPVQPGALVGLDIPLTPLPALVDVRGPNGAKLSIDGELKGELPLSRPVALTPGAHLITVESTGSHPMATWKRVENGTTYDVLAELDTTGQRYGAVATLTIAAGAALTGGVLTGVAFQKQADAEAVLDTKNTVGIKAGELSAFDDAIESRDTYRTGAGIAWGLAAAGATSGVFLFIFDNPTVQAPPAPSTKPSAPAAVPGELESVEISVAPVFGPAVSGFTVAGRF